MQEILTNKTVEKLKYDLVKDKLVSYEEMQQAQEIAQAQKINLAQALIKSHILTEEILLKFIEAKLHIPYLDLDEYTIDERTLSFIPSEDARQYRVLPLFKIEDVLTVAMSDPMDLFVINTLVNNQDLKIEPVICAEKAILKAIDKYYYNNELGSLNTNDLIDWREMLHNSEQNETHLKTLIETILFQAIQENTHELFFEHQTFGLSVIFRKNGETENKGEIPSLLVPLFISTIKTLSKLNPEESELPQLGKLTFKINQTDYTASISAFPTISGERIVVKIYTPPKNFSALNLPFIKSEYIKNLKEGVFLVCGSNLSGKTHFVYSFLKELSETNPNIMTLESIVKYRLTNTNQCELNENVGLNLDKAIRFIEFQNPEVIYFENLSSKSGLEYFLSLALKNKLVITELFCDSIENLRQRLNLKEFDSLKELLSALVFIHNQNSIEIFTKEDLQKFL